MKIVGITSSSTESRTCLNTDYLTAFTRPGVVPVILPKLIIPNRELMTQQVFNETYADQIEAYADRLDSLVISGGQDISPTTYDQTNYASGHCDAERDFMENALLLAFIQAGKPIMGICRGMQLCGLHLFLPHFIQDISALNECHNGAEPGREFKDRQEAAHQVFLRGDLAAFFQQRTGRPDLTTAYVNSFHHQSFCLTADGKRPKISRDNYGRWLTQQIEAAEEAASVKVLACTGMVIEAFEHEGFKMFAVQHHPEAYGPTSLWIEYWLSRYVLV